MAELHMDFVVGLTLLSHSGLPFKNNFFFFLSVVCCKDRVFHEMSSGFKQPFDNLRKRSDLRKDFEK